MTVGQGQCILSQLATNAAKFVYARELSMEIYKSKLLRRAFAAIQAVWRSSAASLWMPSVLQAASADYQAQRRGGTGRSATAVKDEDFVETMFVASTHDYLLFF